MIIHGFTNVVLKSVFLTVCLLVMLSAALAEIRSSSNYQIQSDSVNFGGGLTTSTSYRMESTAGEIATGEATSSNYKLRAGYQQMQEVFISMSAVPSVVMSPNLGGITGGTSNGTTSVLVTTDSPSGYQLTILAANNPAMQKGSDTIADYVPTANPNPDFSFAVGANSVHFGFTPEGTDVTQRWKNNGSACNAGSSSTPLICWDGLSTTAKVIAQGLDNHPNGATTTLRFRVGIGGGVAVEAGDYFATSTLTALPL